MHKHLARATQLKSESLMPSHTFAKAAKAAALA